MILSTTQKFFVVIVLVFLFGFLAFSTISKKVDEETGVAEETAKVNGQDIIELVAKFNAVSINKEIFDSKLFSGLVDFSIALTPEATGRPNPFAPIGVDASLPLNTANQATTTSL